MCRTKRHRFLLLVVKTGDPVAAGLSKTGSVQTGLYTAPHLSPHLEFKAIQIVASSVSFSRDIFYASIVIFSVCLQKDAYHFC